MKNLVPFLQALTISRGYVTVFKDEDAFACLSGRNEEELILNPRFYTKNRSGK